jgi:hypothetical protein
MMCMRSSSGERRLKTRQRRRMKKLGSRNMGIPQPSFERPPLQPCLHPHQHQTDEGTSTMRQCYFSSFSLSSISLWCRSPLAKFLSIYMGKVGPLIPLHHPCILLPFPSFVLSFLSSDIWSRNGKSATMQDQSRGRT